MAAVGAGRERGVTMMGVAKVLAGRWPRVIQYPVRLRIVAAYLMASMGLVRSIRRQRPRDVRSS